MKHIKMASPLFILREECQKDLADVLKRLAEVGYEGIEFAGFFGHSAEEVRKMLDENGLVALGNHVSYASMEENADEVLDFHQVVGCSYMTISELPMDRFDEVAVNYKVFAEKAKKRGIRLLYHNHDHELIEKTDGMENLAWIMEHTDPVDLALEPDLGWIEIGGGDPAWYLEKYVDRCPVIHLKDYYATDRSKLGRVKEFVPARGGEERGHFEFRPTGYGVLNLPKLMPLCLACNPEWFVMDHDLAYERDSVFDLKLSLDYVRNLLAIQK